VINRYLEIEDLTDQKVREVAFGPYNILGSGLIDQSQKMTVAARAIAEKKTVGHRS
jgi:hypothetical protein